MSCSSLLALSLILVSAPSESVEVDGGFAMAIEDSLPRVVKLYGAKIGSEKGYGSGVLVSDDGMVMTVLSLLLEAENLRAVTANGHVHRAEVLYRDNYRQLALLKMSRHAENKDTEATVAEQLAPMDLPFYEPKSSKHLKPGDWIVTTGNPFKIADGPEPVSVMQGIVSGRTKLDAMQDTQPFPYRGEVILVDAITSTVGAPGSALVDLNGDWVGLVGEQVQSRFTNTMLNYAYPIEEIQAFLEDARTNANAATQPAAARAGPGEHGITLSRIGYRKQLPFVQSVKSGSPAAEAGVRKDDLIISANGTSIPRARAFRELCDRLYAGESLSLVIKRGDELITLRMTLAEKD